MRNVKKKIIIIGLLILVMCLGIGFAAFSTTLKINGKAKVSPNASNFKVEFAKSVRSSSDYDRSDVEGVSTPNNLDSNPGKFTDATTFENTSVTFTEDGQSIDYKFYIVNAGKYDAHITNINIGNKKCTPDNDTDLTLAASACDSINLSVILGNPDHQTTYTESTPIENHVLNKGDWEQIIVRITYPEGSQLPDGDLAVEWSFIEIFAATTSKLTPPSPIPTPTNTYETFNLKNNFVATLDQNKMTISGNGEYITDFLELIATVAGSNVLNVYQILSEDEEVSLTYEEQIISYAIFYKNYSLNELYNKIDEDYDENLKVYDKTIEECKNNVYSWYVVIHSAMEKLLNVKIIEFEEGITSICNEAFIDFNIEEIIFPDSLSTIEGGAFEGNKIIDLVIPENIINIGQESFGYNSLTSVKIIGNNKNIDPYAFSGTSLTLDKIDTTQSDFDKTTLILD